VSNGMLHDEIIEIIKFPPTLFAKFNVGGKPKIKTDDTYSRY
jgi:hypothetical protein